MLTDTMRVRAIQNPRYHRYLMFHRADAVRRRTLGRELLAHERNERLPEPQLRIINRVERAIASRKGETIVVRMARQTGKNEVEGMLECRSLSIWRGIPGSIWCRIAPTYRPQIVNSKVRLEKHIRADPLLRHHPVSRREGYIYEYGGSSIQFFSGQKTSNVVGGTASICLSVDEAHKINRGKFEEDFGPFTASTNAPTVMYGVGADKQDMLYEYRQKLDGTDCVLEFPAKVWCELSEAYRKHYEQRVWFLGPGHPIIKTQYDLEDIESLGTYLNDGHRRSLFSGNHPRLAAPRPGKHYAMLVDLGGESEEQAPDDLIRAAEPARDSTFVLILEHDGGECPEDRPYPLVRVVSGMWRTGVDHMKLAPELVELGQHWKISSGAVDARGVGEAVAGAICRHLPMVESYKASAPQVSEDCYDLLARLNTGCVQFWAGDPAEDEELAEFQRQTLHTRYEIHGHTLMRLVKPSATSHIDGVKALTYLHRAIRPYQPLVD